MKKSTGMEKRMQQRKVFYKETGIRIKELREARRLTREKLSAKVGISPQYLYKIERGDACFSSEILYRISRIFGVGCDYILSGEQPQVGMSLLLRLFGEFTEDEKKTIREELIKEAGTPPAKQRRNAMGKQAAKTGTTAKSALAKSTTTAKTTSTAKKTTGKKTATSKKATRSKKAAVKDVAATEES